MKKFFLDKSQIKPLVSAMGYCFATDEITVRGRKVGYMYRENPDKQDDSGWRFFAGDESESYTNNPDNFALYDVNTLANYDTDIIPFLNKTSGAAFERDRETGAFVAIKNE